MNNVPLLLEELKMKYKGISIHKNKTCATWYTRFRKNGRTYYISARTQQECYIKLKKVYKEVSSADDKTQIVLSAWINQWYTLYKTELRARTQQELRYMIEKIPQNLKNLKVANIDALQLKLYIDSLNGQRFKQKMYTILNDVFDKAVKNSLITSNPLQLIKKPAWKAKEKQALTLTEENLLCKKLVGHKELYIFAIAVLQGLRPGELLALEYKDIDFSNMTIKINKSLDKHTSDLMTKNVYSNRVIPLFKKTFEIIKDLDLTLPGRIVKSDASKLNEQLNNLMSDIIDYKITLYNLRHTFVTRLSENNVPEHVIQAWCGHSKGSKVTKETYTHLSREIENKYINILNS